MINDNTKSIPISKIKILSADDDKINTVSDITFTPSPTSSQSHLFMHHHITTNPDHHQTTKKIYTHTRKTPSEF